MKKLRILIGLIIDLPNTADRLRRLEEEIEELVSFRNEVAAHLSDIAGIAALLSNNLTQTEMTGKMLELRQESVEAIDKKIELVQQALSLIKSSPAIGSREINTRNNKLVSLQVQLEGLKEARSKNV